MIGRPTDLQTLTRDAMHQVAGSGTTARVSAVLDLSEDVVDLLGVFPHAIGIEVRRPDVGIDDAHTDQIADHIIWDQAGLEVVRQVAGVNPQPFDRPALTRIAIEHISPVQNERLDPAQYLDEFAEVGRHSGSAGCCPPGPSSVIT